MEELFYETWREKHGITIMGYQLNRKQLFEMMRDFRLQIEQSHKPVVSGKQPKDKILFNVCFGADMQMSGLKKANALKEASDLLRDGETYVTIKAVRAAGASGAVDTVAEARAIIKECKKRENCGCGDECKLTIEDVRKSSEGQP